VKTCPKEVLEIMPLKARIWVPCSSRDTEKKVREICEVGCIGCKICVKVCPAEAVRIEKNVVKIDYEKCLNYGAKCDEICVEKCPRNILRPFRLYKREARMENFKVTSLQ